MLLITTENEIIIKFDCIVAKADKQISSIPCRAIILHTLEWL